MAPPGPSVDAIIASVSLDTKVAEQQIQALEKRAVEVGKAVSKSLSDGMARGVNAGVSNFVRQVRQNQALRNLTVRVKIEPIITRASVQASLRRLRTGTPLGRLEIPVEFKNLRSAVRDLQTQVNNAQAIRLKVEFDKSQLQKEIQQVSQRQIAEGIKILPGSLGLQTNVFNQPIQQLRKDINEQIRRLTIVSTPAFTGGRGAGGQQRTRELSLEAQNAQEEIRKIAQVLDDTTSRMKILFEGIDEGITGAVRGAGSELQRLNRIIQENTDRIIETGRTGRQIFGSVRGLVDPSAPEGPLGTASGNVERVIEARRAQVSLVRELAEGLRQSSNISAEFVDRIGEGLRVVEGLSRQFDDLQDRLRGVTSELAELQRLSTRTEDQERRTNELKEQEQILRRQLEDVRQIGREAERFATGENLQRAQLESQRLVGTGVATGQAISPEALSIAARGESFETGLLREREELRRITQERIRAEKLAVAAAQRGLLVDELDNETKAEAIRQANVEFRSRTVQNQLQRQENNLKQKLITELAQEIDRRGGAPSPFGGQVQVAQAGVRVRDAQGGEVFTDPQETKRLQSLEQQFESSRRKIEEVRAASAALGKTTEANIRIVDKQTGAILINERVFFRYGRQLGDVINLQGRAAAFAQNLGNELFTAAQKVAQWAVATGILFQSVRVLRALIQTATEVNSVMAEMRTVLNPVTTDFDELQDTAGQFARQFGVSIAEAGQAMVGFARQGLEVNDVIRATEAALILSNVSTLSQVESAKQLTAVMKQLDVATSDLLPKVDAITAVSANFAVEAGDLTQGIARSGAAARSVGVDFNELISIVAVVGEATQRAGREVGNAFRTIFARALSRDSIAAFEDLGIEVVKAGGELETFSNIIDQLANRWDGLTQVQQTNIAQLLGGKRRYNEVLALLNNYDRFVEANIISTNSLNDAQFKNQQILNSYAKTIEQTRASLQSLALVFTEGGLLSLLEVFNSAVQGTANGLNALNEASGGIAGAALFGGVGAPVALGAGGFLANTLGLLPPGSPQQSTVQRVSARDFFTQMRAITEEQTQQLKSVLVDIDQSIDRQTQEERIRSQQLNALTGGGAARPGFFATFRERRAAGAGIAGATGAAFGAGGRALGGRIAGGVASLGAGATSLLAGASSTLIVGAVIAAIGALVAVIIKLFENLTRSSEEIVRDEEQRIQLLAKQREAIFQSIQGTAGFGLTREGRVEATGGRATRTELNALVQRVAEIEGLTTQIRQTVDESGNIRLDFGINQFVSDARNAQQSITNINEVIKNLEREGARLNLETAIDAITGKFDLFRETTVRGLEEVETSSEAVEEALQELVGGDIGSDRFKDAIAEVREEFEVLRNQIRSGTQNIGIGELLGDPRDADITRRALELYGERVATLTGETSQLVTQQDKLSAGFRQVFGEIIQQSGGAIQAVNGVFSLEAIERFSDNLTTSTGRFSVAGREIVEVSENVVFSQGRLVNESGKYLEVNRATTDQLRSRLRPELIGFIDDQERNRRVLAVTRRDIFGNIILINEYGESIRTTDDVLKRFTLTNIGFGSQLKDQADSLQDIVDRLTGFTTAIEATSQSISAINKVQSIFQGDVDLLANLGAFTGGDLLNRQLAPIQQALNRIREVTVGRGSQGVVDITREARDASTALERVVSSGVSEFVQTLSEFETGIPQDQIEAVFRQGINVLGGVGDAISGLRAEDVARSADFQRLSSQAQDFVQASFTGAIGLLLRQVGIDSNLGVVAAINELESEEELINPAIANAFKNILARNFGDRLNNLTSEALFAGLEIDEASVNDPTAVGQRVKDTLGELQQSLQQSTDSIVEQNNEFVQKIGQNIDVIREAARSTSEIDFGDIPEQANIFGAIADGLEQAIDTAIEFGRVDLVSPIIDAVEAAIQLNERLNQTVNSLSEFARQAIGENLVPNQIIQGIISKVQEARQAFIDQIFATGVAGGIPQEEIARALATGDVRTLGQAPFRGREEDRSIFAQSLEGFQQTNQRFIEETINSLTRRAELAAVEAGVDPTQLEARGVTRENVEGLVNQLLSNARTEADLAREMGELKLTVDRSIPGLATALAQLGFLDEIQNLILQIGVPEDRERALARLFETQRALDQLSVRIITADKLEVLQEVGRRVEELREAGFRTDPTTAGLLRDFNLAARDGIQAGLEAIGLGEEIARELAPFVEQVFENIRQQVEQGIATDVEADISRQSVLSALAQRDFDLSSILGDEFRTTRQIISDVQQNQNAILQEIAVGAAGLAQFDPERLAQIIAGAQELDPEQQEALNNLANRLAESGLADIGENLRTITRGIRQFQEGLVAPRRFRTGPGGGLLPDQPEDFARDVIERGIEGLLDNFRRIFGEFSVEDLPTEQRDRAAQAREALLAEIESLSENIGAARNKEDIADFVQQLVSARQAMAIFSESAEGLPQIGALGQLFSQALLELEFLQSGENLRFADEIADANKRLATEVDKVVLAESRTAEALDRFVGRLGGATLTINAALANRPQNTGEIVPTETTRFHSGSLGLLRPDEFHAILQRGEAVIPKKLTPLLPSHITNQIPRFHEGFLDFGSNQFSVQSSAFPAEVSDAFVDLSDSLRDIGRSVEESLTRQPDQGVTDALNTQSEILMNVLAELRNLSTLNDPNANNGITSTIGALIEALQNSQSEVAGELRNVASSVSQGQGRTVRRDGEGEGVSEIRLSLSPTTSIPLRVDFGALPEGVLESAIAQQLANNPDLLLQLVREAPIPT